MHHEQEQQQFADLQAQGTEMTTEASQLLYHGQTASYGLLLRPESPCRRGPLDLAIETASN
jgi:hypothetical protein